MDLDCIGHGRGRAQQEPSRSRKQRKPSDWNGLGVAPRPADRGVARQMQQPARGARIGLAELGSVHYWILLANHLSQISMPLRRRGCSPEGSGRSYLLKDLCRENRTLTVSVQLSRAEISRFFPFQFGSNDSPTVSLLGLRNTVDLTSRREFPLACTNERF
jgi:hypothetical protein